MDCGQGKKMGKGNAIEEILGRVCGVKKIEQEGGPW